jgi:AcrR family transcriptional regulator
MSSKKSSPPRDREAREPQRRRGVQRVASLLESASAVIAEKGFESATMAEIATRAGAQIGSLYRFFPSKEALADALMRRYAELVEEAFNRIEAQAESLSIDALADVLVGFLLELHGESRAMIALLEARSEWSVRRTEFRRSALRRITQILLLRSPSLSPETAADVAVVVLHNMKTMKIFTFEPEFASNPGPAAELRAMNRLYLASKLSAQER